MRTETDPLGSASTGPARRVVVLGATGWIGRHLCAEFARHGHDVVGVARRRADFPADRAFRPLDMGDTDVDTLRQLLVSERPDAIVNAVDGANTNDGWDRTEEELLAVNLHAVQRLTAAIREMPNRPRLVHMGTIHEYGPVADGESITESIVPQPVNSYSRSKLAGSTAVLDATRAGDVDGVVLRLVNVLGPHASPASFPGKLLDLLREAAAGARPVLTIADSRRDFVDVLDVTDAIRLAVEEESASGHAFNIGSGRAVEIRELIRRFIAVAGLSFDAFEESEAPVTSVGGAWIQADIRLAEKLLGWQPMRTLEDSFEAMWTA